jgi:hypothetical protein
MRRAYCVSGILRGEEIANMHIDSYQFGSIVIDGISHSSDIIILGDTVQSNWWRKQGHLLSAEDIQSVIAAKPSTLIVGCGASGLMKVAEETQQLLQEHNIKCKGLMNYHRLVRMLLPLCTLPAKCISALK